MEEGYRGAGGRNRGVAWGGEAAARPGSQPPLCHPLSVTLSYSPYSEPHFPSCAIMLLNKLFFEPISNAIIELRDPKKGVGGRSHHTHAPERCPLHASPPLCLDLPRKVATRVRVTSEEAPSRVPLAKPQQGIPNPIATWKGAGYPWA